MFNEFKTRILNDRRMKALFYGEEAVCFQGWVLEIEESNHLNYHLVYARAIQCDYIDDKWNCDINKHNKKTEYKNTKFRLISIEFKTSSNKFRGFILDLLEGRPFLDASNAISISNPSKLDKLLESLILQFPICIRPVMHLPPRNNYVWDTKKVSPNTEASYDSSSITPINKYLFWESLDISLSKKILDMASKKLKGENIDISDIDQWRIGDVEFLVSPGITKVEKSKYNLYLKNNYLEINEKLSSYPLIISLKLFNEDLLIYAFIEEIKIENYPFVLEFNIDDYNNDIFDSYKFEIYEKIDGKVILIVQEGHPILKSINIQGNMISNVSILEPDPWLEKNLPISSLYRAKELNKVERLNNHRYESIINGKKDKDIWFKSNNKIKENLKFLLPKKSESRFFHKLSFNAESRINLAEWLKNLLTKYPNSQIAWFDPFMDSVGINLLNKLGLGSVDYIIFTSKTDNSKKRINRLISQCKNWTDTIGSVKLRILELEGLHDRMLVIRDLNGNPLSGYHFSNSIQRANEKNPLLITEIPLDTLNLVFDYIDNLIKAQNTQGNVIFDSVLYKTEIEKNIIEFDRVSPYQFNKLGWVLSQWWDNLELSTLSKDELQKKLIDLGISFECEDNREKYIEIPNNFWGNIFSTSKFIEEWDAFGYLLANIPAGNFMYKIDFGDISSELTDNLIKYISITRDDSIPLRNKLTVLHLDAYLNMSFIELICNQHPERVFCYEPIEISYSDYYAIQILWRSSTETLVDWLENQLENYDSGNQRQRALITDSLRYICVYSGDLDRSIIIFNSNNELLQWIGLNKLLSLFFEGDITEEELCSIIKNHYKLDKSVIFSWVIRKSVRRNGSFHPIFLDRLVDSINIPMNNEHLILLLTVLRGGTGHMARFSNWTFKYVIEPLIERSLITYDQIIDIWLGELEHDWYLALKDNDLAFSYNNEGEFSNQISYIFHKLDNENKKNSILDKIDKVTYQSISIVYKPLSRSTNYSLYKNAFIISVWALSILNKISGEKHSSIIIDRIEMLKKTLQNIYSRYDLKYAEDIIKYYNESTM